MSDTRIDMTAWDPGDPVVAAQVNARLTEGSTVSHKSSTTVNGILKYADVIAVIYILVVCMLIYGFDLSPWWLVTIVIPYPIIWTLRATQHSVRPMTRKELTQEVQLSEMARRNGAQMRTVHDPGDGLPGNSPLLPGGGSILSMGDSASVNPSFTSMSGTPAEWGNILVDEGERTIFGAWYLLVNLGRPVPHILLNAAEADLPMTVDKGQRVHLNSEFDESFSAYVPAGLQRDVSDFLTDNVRRYLMARAAGLNVEFVGTDVIFFGSHPGHWDTAPDWERVRDLRYQTSLITFPESPAPGASVWQVVRKPTRTPRIPLPALPKVLIGGIIVLVLVEVIFQLIAHL